MEVHIIVQEVMNKTIPKKKKCQKAKWVSKEALQIAGKREAKGKGENERFIFLGLRRESLISLDFCQGPEGTSHGASDR